MSSEDVVVEYGSINREDIVAEAGISLICLLATEDGMYDTL